MLAVVEATFIRYKMGKVMLSAGTLRYHEVVSILIRGIFVLVSRDVITDEDIWAFSKPHERWD